ncbi:hypothetical protein Psi02_77900 [Planotetraspora silvatica]|uniref:Uncharacterized protein n=1 Tax=Planotetraspora silvatica TaxID=234614 RepID=A0A8J3XTA1_9ACTN|nr:hypothetical protein Psi02_77900 [Planotetraspora silvatica]
MEHAKDGLTPGARPRMAMPADKEMNLSPNSLRRGKTFGSGDEAAVRDLSSLRGCQPCRFDGFGLL